MNGPSTYLEIKFVARGKKLSLWRRFILKLSQFFNHLSLNNGKREFGNL
jgi:hypothetical protein